MSAQSSRVDAFVSRARKRPGETRKLRSILLDCGLDDDAKWGKPCFMFIDFTNARRSETRTARIEKCVPKILTGKGLNDHS